MICVFPCSFYDKSLAQRMTKKIYKQAEAELSQAQVELEIIGEVVVEVRS